MNLYKFFYCVDKCAFFPSDEEDSKILRNELCNGNYVAKYDSKIRLELIEGSDKELKKFDFVYLYDDGLLANQRTFEVLNRALGNCGKWTRMQFKDIPYYFFSTLKFLDCLDVENTIYHIYEGTVEELKGTRYGIKEHVFKDFDYTSHPIFRITQEPFPIVTQEFVDILSENQIAGLKFERI